MTSLGFVLTIVAISILLSVIVRALRSDIAWSAIEEGTATAEHLQEVTGILDRNRLQEVFGPPRLADGVYVVTRQEAMRQRTAIGYLLGDRWLDLGSGLLALIAVLPVWPLWTMRPWIEPLLYMAGIYQAAGWMMAMRLPARR